MSEDEHTCTACQMTFATERGLEEHRFSEHGEGRRRRHQD